MNLKNYNLDFIKPEIEELLDEITDFLNEIVEICEDQELPMTAKRAARLIDKIEKLEK